MGDNMKTLAALAFLLIAIPAQAQNKSELDPPLTAPEISAAMVRVKHERYFHRVLDSADQFFGALLGRQNDQTISSATEIAARNNAWYDKPAVVLNVGLDLIQQSHGQLAQAGDIERCNELIATDAAALTKETGVQVIPTVGGALIKSDKETIRVQNLTRKIVRVTHGDVPLPE
jgi:hypothetical protein